MTFEAVQAKPKRIRRWAKRSTDPNHGANAFLSVRDVHLIIRELEGYERRIQNLRGRDASGQNFAAARRHARRLIDKLHQVRWTP